MAHSAPGVSVIIPMFNASATIEKCLSSIFSNSYKNFEVIVVDDNSTDGSVGRAKKFPCHVISGKKKLGPGGARNLGAKSARGEILVFVDSDTIVPKHWLERFVQRLSDKSLGAVAAQYNGSIEKGTVSLFAFLELLFRERAFKGFINSFPSCNFAVRKKAFFEAGGFNSRFFASEDLEFSHRLTRKHKAVWDAGNSVLHHFRPSLWKYLKQQSGYVRKGLGVVFLNPKAFTEKGMQDRSNYIEIVLAPFVLLSAIAAIACLALPSLNVFIGIVALVFAFFSIATLAINLRFFAFAEKRLGFWFVIKSVPIVFLRNLSWSSGVVRGLLDIAFSHS